ncbi:MAG: glycosyltransferase family 1 protein [Pyrinomonadaceae bacterium]
MATNSITEKTSTAKSAREYDLLCFSHLRWDFVYQRPQHLLSRFARIGRRVFFIEEPIFSQQQSEPRLDISPREENLFVVVPHIASGIGAAELSNLLALLLDNLIEKYKIENFISWYYTPMMFSWSEHLAPSAIVFDSMDELSLFKFAPPELLSNEEKLLARADVVFTGGQSLYEAKKDRHHNIHAFSSSIDVKHFSKTFEITEDVADQKQIPHPRIGFCGVIDERMDIELLNEIAELRPDYHFIMIGPVVKIDEQDLPRRANIHYLGAKKYDELPEYLAGWDAAMMPFALNESTRFISPTKTPEYLAAGLPVVSTPIRDVIRPYGEMGLTRIAANAEEFVAEIEKALNENYAERQQKANEFLAQTSWDKTFEAMKNLIDVAVGAGKSKSRAAVD